MNGATAGMRYDVNGNFKFGGLLGVDNGTINGALIDTDAQGFVLGTFSSYQFNDPYKTMLTGTAAFGNYTYDAARRSFGGDATADSIGSDAVELSLGVSSVVYENQGFRVAPSGALRYMGGSVDNFVEKGPGVPLAVDSQDIDTVLFDVGFDLSYQLMERLSLAGRVGYVDILSNSEESVSASFAASGPAGVPFAVSAPGIHNQAVTLGVGLFYDITENTRIGATYRGEFRTESQSSQTFGLGASYGF
jgi:outer membrane autotransporter protein